MTTALKLPQAFLSDLRCPRCFAGLRPEVMTFRCASCELEYLVPDGTPILIDPEKSVYRPVEIVAAFEREKQPGSKKSLPRRLLWSLASLAPHIPSYARQVEIAERFSEFLRKRPNPKLLIAGSGAEGLGLSSLLALPGVAWCEFDVYLTDERMLVADLHDLPFRDETFDAVVAQGVLEHVLDPHRAVDQIHRVLKANGLILSTTPFVMGVHLEVHDYTRFSRLGLIRLFRRFRMLECDAIEGASVALAYAISYFAMALCSSERSPIGAKFAKYFVNFFVFWLRAVDRLLRRRPVSVDAAASYYYIGTKSEDVLDDRTLVGFFKGTGLCPW